MRHIEYGILFKGTFHANNLKSEFCNQKEFETFKIIYWSDTLKLIVANNLVLTVEPNGLLHFLIKHRKL